MFILKGEHMRLMVGLWIFLLIK